MKKRERIINAILIVIYILTLAVILFLVKSNIFKKKPEEVVEIKPNSNFEVYEVENLAKKMKKVSFTSKKQDYYNKSKITVNVTISGGKVNVSIKNGKKKNVYIVEGIEKATSIATNVSDGIHVTYILTEEGKVYRLEDKLSEVKANPDYKNTAVDLGLTNVVKIGIDKTLKFKINSELEKVTPCVYIKTDDDRFFTDELIIEGQKIVELVEKEVEENTSEG